MTAIDATFTSIKHVQGRKVYQLVLEVAQENIDHALAVLGGMPKSDDPVWVAVARLRSAGERSDAGPARADESESRPRGGSTTGGGHDVENRGIAPLSSASPGVMTGDAPDKPRRPFHELPPTTQAVLACQDERFQQWVLTGHAVGDGDLEEMAAFVVRDKCGVESRSQLNGDIISASIWRHLYARYRRETGLEAEPR